MAGGFRGRRERAVEGARRSALNMRTTAAVRSALEASAAKNGRTLTHEVEARIEQSLRADGLRQIIREEIRAALGKGEDVIPFVEFNGTMVAVNAEGRVTSPKHLADKGIHLCEPPRQSHSPIPVNAAGESPWSTNDHVRDAIAKVAEQQALRRQSISHHPV